MDISIVTPSFNQAEFLPACIASVTGQTHSALEHLVFDPGSTDGSREIAAAAAGVTLFAEPDDGQADAVARGMKAARGEVIGWLNSDDVYADETVFASVLARFAAADQPDLVYGRGTYIDANGDHLRDAHVIEDPAELGTRLHHEVGILQPTVFIRASALRKVEPPLSHLHFAMDYDLWIRAAKAGLRFAFLPMVLASGRYYLDNKTMGMREKSYTEVLDITTGHFGAAHVRWARRLAQFRVANADGILDDGMTADAALVDRETTRILWAYNYPVSSRATLQLCNKVDPYTETIAFMKKQGLDLRTHAREIAPGAPPPPRNVTYTVDDKTWAFDKNWVDTQLESTTRRIEQLRQRRSSDTCVIAGNGPSLNSTDMTLLEGTDVFITNFAHLKDDLFEQASYLCVVNNLVAEQGAAVFNQMEIPLFAPWWLSYCLAPADRTYFVPSVGHAEFSTDISKNVSWRHTVSFFCMQLAYGLGYRRVGLIGFDHSYRQQSDVTEGDRIDQTGDDENHFDPNYFKAKAWHAADVDAMEAMYRLAQDAFAADQREITNCTVGGHLELFPRADLATWL